MSIRLTVGVLILATLLLLTACSNPSEVEPPPAITGNYTGIYSYTEIHNGVDTVIDTTQLIEFIFRQQEFSMDINGSIPESLRVFCDVAGEYELGNGVDLTCDLSNWPDSCGDTAMYPSGYFSLDMTTDTIRMLNDKLDSLGVRRVRDLRIVNAD